MHRFIAWTSLFALVLSVPACQQAKLSTKTPHQSVEPGVDAERLKKSKQLIRENYLFVIDEEAGTRYLAPVKDSSGVSKSSFTWSTSKLHRSDAQISERELLDRTLVDSNMSVDLGQQSREQGLRIKSDKSYEPFLNQPAKRFLITQTFTNTHGKKVTIYKQLYLVFRDDAFLQSVVLGVGGVVHIMSPTMALMSSDELNEMIEFEYELVLGSIEEFDFHTEYFDKALQFCRLNDSTPRFIVKWQSYSGTNTESSLASAISSDQILNDDSWLIDEAERIAITNVRLDRNFSGVYERLKKAGFDGVELNKLKLTRATERLLDE